MGQYASTLLGIFEERIQWKSSPDLIQDHDRISMSDSDLLDGINGVLTLSLKLNPTSDPERYTIFWQKVEELSKVPKLQMPCDKDKPVERNEILAAFIAFLVRLLHYGTDQGIYLEKNDMNVALNKELRFLVAVLGDTIITGAELEEVEGLLAEIEAVANEAGSLLHSLIFRIPHPVHESVDEAHGVLLQQIDILKANIIEFSNRSRGAITRKTVAAESLFIVDSFTYDLQDLINQEGTPIVDVKEYVKTLHSELIFWQSFLKDLKVPLSEMEELKEPAMQIRDAACEAEYLINSFLVEDIPLWYLNIRLPDVIHKIKLIGSGLQELKKTREIVAQRVAMESNAKVSLQTKKNSDVDDIIIVGFEEREKDILDELTGRTEQLQTISIFGMPGLGKTTLAKKLYNHPLVNYHFDKCSWCVVSQNYDSKRLLTDILIDLASDLDRDRIMKMEVTCLAQHIYQCLKGRRYLIVMDDIWNSNMWDNLRRYFPNDGNGSRILFTSRIKDVAPLGSIIHPLPSLSDDQCWELLEKRVFRNKLCPTKVQEIGKKIAAKCGGLPLAVVVIAGILSTLNEEKSTWQNVEQSLTSYVFADPTNSVRQILELSYKHLPDNLKPCFLYLVTFVEHPEIRVHKIKQLWIAEGFISREEKNSESAAEKCLMELIDRSLLIVTKRRSDGGVKTCVIHDLLREFCFGRAEEDNFFKLVDRKYSVYEKHHRLHSLSGQSDEYLRPFGLHVRSLFFRIDCGRFYFINLKLLRVLDLWFRYSCSDFSGIEALVHLRYLAINEMPESIASLVNLEFLIVRAYSGYMPSAFLKLPKLRFLHINQVIFEKNCDCSLANNLESLSNVWICNLKDEAMLKYSPHLRKLKCQFKPIQVNQRAYRLPDLRFLTQLESLTVSFVHAPLMPKTYEKYEFAEIYFPSNIRKLTLSDLRLPWENMSIIGGLPKLEVLKLRDYAFEGERWDTRDDEFQQLRFLELMGLELIQWNASSEHFQLLQQLVLEKCYKLEMIPCEIGQIDTLQSIEVKWCAKSAVESVIQIQEQQKEMGNEEFKVIITRLDDDGDSWTSSGFN